MKHKIVTIVLVVLAVALISGGVAAWHTERGRAWAAQLSQSAREQSVERVRKQRVQDEYDKLNAQCKSGQASYDANTVAYKKAHARPVCDLPLVQ
jgi:uncharacterized protein YxeA